MSHDLSPLFDWRSAVASSHGPKSPTTRHVLLTLSLWMSVKGDSCYPSTRTLSEASGLSRRAVETHLAFAGDDGWIKRDGSSFSGQGWRQYRYAARIPRSVLQAIQAEKQAGEPHAPRPEKGGEPRDKKVGNDVPTKTPEEDAKELSLELGSNGVLPKGWKPGEWEVFTYWRERRDRVVGKNGGPQMKPNDKRHSKIRARLEEGYTVPHLKEAVDGNLTNEQNVRRGHTDIELVCRDQQHVEQYRAWNTDATQTDKGDETVAWATAERERIMGGGE